MPRTHGRLGAASFAAVCVTVAALLAASPARAAADAAEALARAHYHEGVPFEAARAIDAAGAERLVELLEDPTESASHAQIVELLGMSGHALAYAAIDRFADGLPRGRLDHATFRKQVAVRIALGYLARSDDRALAELIAEATAQGSGPNGGATVAKGLRYAEGVRRAAISGLGLSGRRQAASVLRQLEHGLRGAAPPEQDPELARHLASALALHGRHAHSAGVPAESPRR